MKKLFTWHFTNETMLALIVGGVMILLSLAMIPFDGERFFDQLMHFLLRDVLMILGLGICFVTTYCTKHHTWRELGMTKEKLRSSLVWNVVLGGALLAMFLSEGVPQGFFKVENLYAATYILVAGIFEMLFIYGFLRMAFQKAFGVIPAILLTAAFYSFHHAGFQPEFLHLFFVGIMYVSVFYITKSLWVIFPFFWGVGALWDVLVDSTAGEAIKNSESFWIAIAILVGGVIWWKILNRRYKKDDKYKDIKEVSA